MDLVTVECEWPLYVGPVTEKQVHVFYIAVMLASIACLPKLRFFRLCVLSKKAMGTLACGSVCKPADGSFIKSCLLAKVSAVTHSEKVRIKSHCCVLCLHADIF